MGVDFRIENPLERVDIELAKISSLSEIDFMVDQILKERSPRKKMRVSMFPPFMGDITIPLAFKMIVKYYNELVENEIGLVVYIKHEVAKDFLIKFLPYKDHPKYKCVVGTVEVIVQVGDIFLANTKAIVNASNNDLKLGGLVSGTIREAANPDIQIQLNKIALLSHISSGEAVITNSFGIKGIEKIIHVSSVEGTEEVIRKCLENTLLICDKHYISSIAIPALGAGTGGLQMIQCAKITMQQIFNYYDKKVDSKMKEIKIVLWRKRDYDTFVDLIGNLR
jgi:O-acetyl-ADP-ribose deacetylase